MQFEYMWLKYGTYRLSLESSKKIRQYQRERAASKSRIIYCFWFSNLKRSLIMHLAHLTFSKLRFLHKLEHRNHKGL